MSKEKVYMKDTERQILVDVVALFDKMPIEKKYFLLGYMQSEADMNLQRQASVNA